MTNLHAEPQALDAERSRRLALLARYDQKAPRYTSYPTALQFSQDVGADVYEQWLATLAPDQALSLYVHIPLCEQLCWYCGCNTRAVNKSEHVSAYVARLIDELALLEKRLPHRPRLKAIHLGGGTPNLLSRDDLVSLFFAIRHVFTVGSAATIAAELDPATLTQAWVRAAVFHGLTRASLGVQTLAPHVQAAVNRHLSLEQLSQATGWLREAGVGSINFDLMYGLPGQTVGDVEQTLEAVLALRPDRLAVFGYAHVPWAKPHQKLLDAAGLADASGRLEQQSAAHVRLTAAGYRAIGLDHYALPGDALALAARDGTLRRSFQGYTADPAGPLIGLGASAIGSLPQGYVQNVSDERGWREALARGRLPVARGVILTDEDRLRACVIERLMCDGAVDLPAVCRDHGARLEHLSGGLRRLENLRADGLAEIRDGRVAVTALGRPFLRTIAQVFDARSSGETGLSRAI